MAKIGDLRVWHIPQVPGKSFIVPVASLQEAGLIIDTLAQYDLFQYENRIKPDYANVSGVSVYEDEDDTGCGEWYAWWSDDGEDFDEWWAVNRPAK